MIDRIGYSAEHKSCWCMNSFVAIFNVNSLEKHNCQVGHHHHHPECSLNWSKNKGWVSILQQLLKMKKGARNYEA